jgi:hypothetical protein
MNYFQKPPIHLVLQRPRESARAEVGSYCALGKAIASRASLPSPP